MVLELAKTLVDKIDADLFITSAEGLSLEEGMTTSDCMKPSLRAYDRQCPETIALVDHTNDK